MVGQEVHEQFTMDVHLLLHKLDNVFRKDDKDLFVSMMKKTLGESELCPPPILYKILYKICKHNAINCATALLEGETGHKVDINTFFITNYADHEEHRATPLHTAVSCVHRPNYLGLIRLFLRYGARTDLKIFAPGTDHHEMVPLNLLLYGLRSSWTPKQSIFRLIILLCNKYQIHQMGDQLEAIRLLVEHGPKEVVDEEIVNYVKEGKVMELAALLLAVPEKVTTAPIFSSDATSDGSMVTIRQYLLGEISLLEAIQTSFDYRLDENHPSACQRNSLALNLKDKLALRSSQLLLLEVCERVGDKIMTYLKEHQHNMGSSKEEEEVVKDVVSLLHNAGFSLTFEDYDLRGTMQDLYARKIHGRSGILDNDDDESDHTDFTDHSAPIPHVKPFYERLGVFWSLVDKSVGYDSCHREVVIEPIEPKDRYKYLNEEERQSGLIPLGKLFASYHMKVKPSLEEHSFNTLCRGRQAQPIKHLNLDDNRLKSLAAALENLRGSYWRLAGNLQVNWRILGQLLCLYAKEGKLVELAALLMVTCKKLITTSKETSHNGYSSNEMMAMRQCFISEIQSIIDEETKFIGQNQSGIQMCKYRKQIMSSALLLLDVFEEVGLEIDHYHQRIRYKGLKKVKVAEDLQYFIWIAGFILKEKDTNLQDMMCFKMERDSELKERFSQIFAVNDAARSMDSNLYKPKESKYVGAMSSGNQMASYSGLSTRSFHTSRIGNSKLLGTQTNRIQPNLGFDKKWAVFAVSFKRGIKRI
ncbi:hypothetical protein CCACVL1_29397 [Corchorus capsularis]|uniref:Uncharacterized protein n=1 Tax=Corchorus capsularis TaxID=210143 RepID=A0A1R3G1Y2_COCAP|nr:hypothetical protein CCACVL1_29397 [Corchorus capsularis]